MRPRRACVSCGLTARGCVQCGGDAKIHDHVSGEWLCVDHQASDPAESQDADRRRVKPDSGG